MGRWSNLNVVLIGMPGCGKTTLGTLAAKRMGRSFWDIDVQIERQERRSIREIFASGGEPYFRELEARMTKEAARQENAVISTGGGVVLREDNMAALATTGTIFFLDRPPEEIAVENHVARPLLDGGPQRLLELYAQRIPLYKKYAKYTIPAGQTAEDSLFLLVNLMRENDLLFY